MNASLTVVYPCNQLLNKHTQYWTKMVILRGTLCKQPPRDSRDVVTHSNLQILSEVLMRKVVCN